MADLIDDFFEFDMTVGADLVKCPHCGSQVSRSLLLGEDVKCPECGELIKDK
jgi:endogenous inhibitor of DNA gyrase (YacG/DUF329 family)